MKKLILSICILVISTLLIAGCGKQEDIPVNTVTYQGSEYVCLEYPLNVFYYYYNGNSHDNFAEVDGTYPIDSSKWDMVWSSGDLYCIKSHVDKANSFYSNDDNYVWYVVIDSEGDSEDSEINSCPVEVTDEELEEIYAVEDRKRDLAVFFEDFEKMGSLFKISEDGMVRGTISIGKYDGKWYWRSEVIDESQERDGTWPEYVQPLPDTIDLKIKENE